MPNQNRNKISRDDLRHFQQLDSQAPRQMSNFPDVMDPTPTSKLEKLSYFESEDGEPQVPVELQEYTSPNWPR